MHKPNKTHTIVVFPDGQTWNTIGGCTIKVIHEEAFNDLVEDRIDASDIPVEVELTLTETTFNVI